MQSNRIGGGVQSNRIKYIGKEGYRAIGSNTLGRAVQSNRIKHIGEEGAEQ